MLRIIFLTACLHTCMLQAQEFNIRDFGAVPDAETLNTSAIQAAIDAAHHNGGGRVIIPAGAYLTGTIVLQSQVELHLMPDAVLLGSTNVQDYKKLNRWMALIMADNTENIAITGKGKIDGRGRMLALHIDSLFYAGAIDSINYNFSHMRPKEYMRPQIIEFVNCTNIEIRNITLVNGACWLQTYERCTNVVIDSIIVRSDAYWNNDGIDIVDCRNVRITYCDIDVADDGICLKSVTPSLFCDSIYVAHCNIRSSASAVKFGTVSHGGFKNVVIENIYVYNTFRSAIAIECVDGGTLENVLVTDMKAVNTGNAIFIRLGERTKRGDGGQLKNVTIKNMQVEIAFERPDYAYDIRGPALPFFHNPFPSSITGIPGKEVENVLLENIEIQYPGRGNPGLAYMPLSRLDEVPENIKDYPEFSMFGELPAWGFYVRHVNGISLKNVKLSIAAPDYRPAIIFDDVKGLTLESIVIEGDEKQHQIILYRTESEQLYHEKNVLQWGK
jgi:polygalacturonase